MAVPSQGLDFIYQKYDINWLITIVKINIFAIFHLFKATSVV
jgi:hypothetical protein